MSSTPLMTDSKTRPQRSKELTPAENIVLPRDKTSRYVCFFKQHIRIFAFLLFHITIVVILAHAIFHIENPLLLVLACFIMVLGFFLLFAYVPLFIVISGPKYLLDGLSKGCKMKLLVEVINHKPNISIDTWNLICIQYEPVCIRTRYMSR